MSYADLMEAMAAKGAPIEAIIMAVRALEAKDEEANKKRAAVAERKRRQRERERDSHATITGQSQENPLSPSPLLSPHTPQITPHPHTPVSNISTRARKDDPFPMPEGVNEQAWADFMTNRRRKRFANTATAYKRLMDDLARLQDDEWPPGRLIEHAAAMGWGAIYDPRNLENRNGTGNRTTSQPAKVDGFTTALRHIINGGHQADIGHGHPDGS